MSYSECTPLNYFHKTFNLRYLKWLLICLDLAVFAPIKCFLLKMNFMNLLMKLFIGEIPRYIENMWQARHGITNYLKMDVFVFGFQTFKEFECIFSFITTWKVPVFGVCLVRIFSYSLQLPERTDQKNSEYGHLQCVALLWICDNEIFTLGFTHFTLKIHSKII